MKKKILMIVCCFFINFCIFSQEALYSEIGVPVKLSVKTIEQTMNQKMKDTIFYDPKFKSDYGVFNVLVKKLEPVKLAGVENQTKVNIKSAFKVFMKGTLETNFLGIEIKFPLDQAISMKVWLNTIFDLEKNWQLTTKTTMEKHDFLDNPMLDLGLVQLPLRIVADAMIAQNKEFFTTQLDEQLKPYLSWKVPIQEAWNNLQQPLPLSEWEKDTIWVQMQPQNINMTKLNCQKDTFYTHLKIPLKSIGKVKQKPSLQIQLLPDYNVLPEKTPFGELKIKTQIDRNLAEEKINKMFVNQEFENGKYKSKVQKITFYNAKKGLWGIEIDMKGTINGKLFLEAIPKNNKGKIEIKDLTYRIEGEKNFSKFGEWLFKGKIKKQMRKAIEEPINAQIDWMKKEIEKTIKKYKIPPYAIVFGKIYTLNWDNFVLGSQTIEADLSIKGEWIVEMIGF
jgi:hypothetical protein